MITKISTWPHIFLINSRPIQNAHHEYFMPQSAKPNQKKKEEDTKNG